MQVLVNRFEELDLARPTVAVECFYSPDAGDKDDLTSVRWRITFHEVLAFKCRPIPIWKGRGAFPRLYTPPLAMWRVLESSWYGDVVPPGNSEPYNHYVITSQDDAYEVLAMRWTAQQLP